MHLSVVCLSVSTNVILCVYLGDDMDRWVAWLICGWLVDLLVYCLGHWPTNQLLHGLTLQIWRGSFLLKLVQNKEQYIYRYLPIEFHVYTPLYPMFHVFVFVCVSGFWETVWDVWHLHLLPFKVHPQTISSAPALAKVDCCSSVHRLGSISIKLCEKPLPRRQVGRWYKPPRRGGTNMK